VINNFRYLFAFQGALGLGKFCWFVGGREDMNRSYIWQPAYLTAVAETDDAMMMGRILEARAAIEQRLLVPIEEDSVEYTELVAAQKALEVLKSERVDKIDLHANAFSGAIRPGCVSESSGLYGS
jgi:hypothetical protein